MTVKIISATPCKGYSHLDHYITGNELDDLIGREYRSVAAAKKAADALWEKKLPHKSMPLGPVRLTLRDDDSEYEVRT